MARVLIIGSGAREHALAWRIARGAGDVPAADRVVIVAPGNAGIAREFHCKPSGTSPEAIVAGCVDALQASGIPVFGPTKEAARLEGSKAFMKSVCARAGVATASSVATTRLDDARRFIDERARSGRGVVVK